MRCYLWATMLCGGLVLWGDATAAAPADRYATLQALQQHFPQQIAAPGVEEVELLNVSYDPTRELYEDINALFSRWWQRHSGQSMTIRQSHGGSGKQARAVAQGLQADVVTLALALDIDAISQRTGWLPADWQGRLPNKSVPFTSTVVFLVKKGNPKQVRDWDDLVRPGIAVITPNPKTSGGARWNYLAAWAYAMHKYGGDERQTLTFMKRLFQNVPILDTGARGATTTFIQRAIGDVLVTWENEAHLALKEEGGAQFEIVVPSRSIAAEPPVAWVDFVVDKKGTRQAAEHYLAFLYTPAAQRLAARHFLRPVDPTVAREFRQLFPAIPMAQIDSDFGGWQEAQRKHFDDGGTFDQIYLQH